MIRTEIAQLLERAAHHLPIPKRIALAKAVVKLQEAENSALAEFVREARLIIDSDGEAGASMAA